MKDANKITDNQAAFWNGIAGNAWVDAQALLDSMFKPFENMLVDAMITQSRNHVLDVGCGAGSTTLAIARHLQTDGSCTGVDISAPMIAAAQSRANSENAAARFICADAQTYNFAPNTFDMIISRFGVMFFDDPVAAFANLRRAARDGAELRFIAWRSAEENLFMTAAERVAAPLLPGIPAREPDAPGQFAFADHERVLQILERSGWSNIDIQPIDVMCKFPEQDLVAYLTQLGPLGRRLHGADEQTINHVMTAVLPAFKQYIHATEVRYSAACWIVVARANRSLNEEYDAL
jgi:SAM-dependent methyltransferase